VALAPVAPGQRRRPGKLGEPRTRARRSPRVGAAAFQWLNPKSWLVSTSAVGTYLQADAETALVQSAFIGALFVAAALPTGFIWLPIGVGLQRTLASPRRLRIFNVAMGSILASSVAWFLW
jgi:threonine/homoserine/homoserine lactone efflux protein